MITFTVPTLAELPTVAKQVIDVLQLSKIWLFEGEMGAGKTTFIKEICRQLGVESHVQSPTFSIVNEYLTTHKQVIYHFDCYRLKNSYEALDFGIEEYFDSGNLCLVEWPSKIEAILPMDTVTIRITQETDDVRTIEIENEREG